MAGRSSNEIKYPEKSLDDICNQAIINHINMVQPYRCGEKAGLLGLFMGEAMKLSKGNADPKVLNEMLLNKLNSK